MVHRTQMTAEASRGPKRKAVQTKKGVHKKVHGSFLIWAWKTGPKTMPAVKSVQVNKTHASRSCFFDHVTRGFKVQRSRKGAKIRAPAASPSHQVRQLSPY